MSIIAFEGIDACGKSTQIRMLKEYAARNEIPCAQFNYPNYESETGKKILELLKSPDGTRDPLVLQSLMTANRYEDQYMLRALKNPEQKKEGIIILDRYWMSGMVYGRFDRLSLDWLLRVHENLIQPDLWVVLDISVEESFRRRPHRMDAYESNEERLQACRQYYRDAQDMIPDVALISGSRPAEEVHDMVLTRLLGEGL